MEANDGISTPTTIPEFLESDNFELVTRKRRGKRRENVVSLNLHKDSNSYFDLSFKAVSDTDRSVNLNEDKSDSVEMGKANRNVIYGVNFVDYSAEVSDTITPLTSRITLDAQMSKPPSHLVELPTKSEEEEKEEYKGDIDDPAHEGNTEQIIDVINKRALPKYAPTYELEKFEKNALLVFNQTNIQGYKPRLGTEKDVAALKRTFETFGFEIEVEEDFTKEQIMAKLKEFSSRDFTDYGCVAVAVLTHGSKHGLIRAKDLQYSELEIVKHLQVQNKPTLVTKPKVVIIQACRGMESIKGVPVFQAQGKIMKDLDEEVEPYTLPVESDMLILHSSYIGKPSHRDELHGSWFIQSLCSKINQLAATLDFESIITEVKREVAVDRAHLEHNRRTFETDINKQMPVSTSTLLRKLYLRKFNEETPILPPSVNSAQLSNNYVLDNSLPNTPLLVQFGPCSCFLEYYDYITRCLRLYLENYPEDDTARSFLDVSSTFDEGVGFNSAKEKMTKAICNYLRSKVSDQPYFQYLYFYKH